MIMIFDVHFLKFFLSDFIPYTVLPQIIPFDFGDSVINEFDMVSAYCSVNKGDLPIDISWRLNDRRIFTNDGISITRSNQRSSVLSIESVRDRQAGNYTCVASNVAGTAEYTTVLAFNGENYF